MHARATIGPAAKRPSNGVRESIVARFYVITGLQVRSGVLQRDSF